MAESEQPPDLKKDFKKAHDNTKDDGKAKDQGDNSMKTKAELSAIENERKTPKLNLDLKPPGCHANRAEEDEKEKRAKRIKERFQELKEKTQRDFEEKTREGDDRSR